jgi:predicted Zn-dependent protease
LIEHLELKEYTLMGVSYGGLISMELANGHKSEVQKLIVFDAPIKYLDSNDINTVTSHFNAPSIEELFVPSKPEGLKKLLSVATGKKSHLPKAAFKDFHMEAYVKNLKEMRGLITNMMGRLEESAAAYRQSVRLQPDNATAWERLGEVLIQTDQLSSAAKALKRGIGKVENPRLYFLLAQVYAKANKEGRARETLENYLDAAPDDAPDRAAAETLLRRLQRR